VLPFAAGQFLYAAQLLSVYYLSVSDIARVGGFSLVIKKIYSRYGFSVLTAIYIWQAYWYRPSDPKAFILSYFSWPLLTLSGTFFSQSFFKHLLTQGDTFLISALTSPTSQGIYALASNYGGLIARLLFQPIEEISRNYFGKLLSSTNSPPGKLLVSQAQKNLVVMLRSYTLIFIPAVVLGPTIAPLLLNIVAGAQWRSSGAGEVLATYCYYIPLLGINGLTEAFVASVATEAELAIQTLWMLGFSASFAGAAVVFLQVLDMGAKGLVWANAFNMFLRIIWCTVFIKGYLKRYGAEFELKALMPLPLSVALGVGTWAVMRQLATTFTGGFMDLVKSGGLSVAFVGTL